MSVTIKQRVEELIEQHGGVRRAARACGIDNAYFHRLSTGEKTEPSAWTLRKLGLKRVTTYVRSTGDSQPVAEHKK